MEFFKTIPNYDFMGRSGFWIAVSVVLVAGSLVVMFTLGPRWGIDFAGGTEIQVAFDRPTRSADLRKALSEMGLPASEVVTIGGEERQFLIRLQAVSPVDEQMLKRAREAFGKRFSGIEISKFDLSPGGDKLTIEMAKNVPIAEVEKGVVDAGLRLGTADERGRQESPSEGEQEENADSAKRCEGVTCTWPQAGAQVYEINLKGVSEQMMDGLRTREIGKGAQKLRSEWVGPKAGKQLREAGIASIAYALLFIMIYIAVRFDLRFAPGAVIALFHDATITLGVFTVARLEVTMTTVAAVLTIVGYSINDTIVVYDRIRENLGRSRDKPIEMVINRAINETLSRTILTSGTTLLTDMALLVVGWNTSIRDFAFAMAVGILIGTYSSIFIASPIVVWLERRFARARSRV